MIIERLDLIAYGRFTEHVIDLSAGPNRFHLIYGPNESGKSTSLRAIHALLFGFPARTDDDYVHSYQSMRVGGRLLNSATGKGLDCVRKKGNKNTLITPNDGSAIDPEVIARMLGGIDAETFAKRFGLSHDELVEGGQAIISGEGDLGEVLFAAGTGTARLRAVQKQLDDDCKALFVPRGSSGSLNKLLADYQAAEKTLRDLRLLPRTYEERREELARKQREVDAVGRRLKEQEVRLARLNALEQSQEFLPQRAELETKLKSLGQDVPMLDDDFVKRRRGLESELQGALQRVTTYREQIAERTRRRDAIVIDRRFVEESGMIRTLMNELGEIEGVAESVADWQREESAFGERIESLTRSLRQSAAEGAGAKGDRDVGGDDETLLAIDVSDTLTAEVDRMLGDRARLAEKRDAAKVRERGLHEKIAKLCQRLEGLPEAIDPKPLAQAIASVGKPGDLVEDLTLAEEDAAGLARRVEERVSRLRGLEGGLDAARRFVPPDPMTLRRLEGEIADADEAIAEIRRGLVEAQRSREEIDAKLRDGSSGDPPPTREGLEEARELRDLAVDRLRSLNAKGEPLPEGEIEKVAQRIRAVDRITDALFAAHDRVVRHQRLVEDLKGADEKIAGLWRKQEESAESRETLRSRWSGVWRECGVAAGEPEAMRRWLEDHAELMGQIGQWDAKRTAVVSAGEKLRVAIRTLKAAIRITGGEVQPGSPADDRQGERDVWAAELIATHAVAESWHDSIARRAQERSRVVEELERATAELDDAINRRVDSEGEWQGWEGRWEALTGPLKGWSDSEPIVLPAVLRRLRDMGEARGAREQVRQRIARGIGRCERYWDKVADVAGEVGLVGTGDGKGLIAVRDRSGLVHEMARKATEQSEKLVELKRLEEDIETLGGRLSEAVLAQETAHGSLQRMCAEAGCESIDELPSVEEAAGKRRLWEGELRTTQQGLRALAHPMPLDDFLREAQEYATAGVGGVGLGVEIDEAEAVCKGLREQYAEGLQTVGMLRREVEKMDGSGEAARVQQEQLNRLAAIRRQAERYAELTISQEALKQAIELYRQRNEGPVLRTASRFFSRITRGEYESLRVEDDDKPRLVGVRPGRAGTVVANRTVVANGMSDGTADALYLSLRLASLESHLDECDPVPLIVDDCLVQFDDDRSIEALKIFAELSQRTQVILFTHHRHLIELAEGALPRGAYHVHRLS